jgi:hypothetical protein
MQESTVMRLRRCLVAAGLSLFLAVLSVRGDDPGAAKATKKSPGHDELARLVGDWDAIVTYQIAGKENQGKARCQAKWILNDNCVQQEYNSNFMGRPLTILQLLSYDPGKKKIVEVHMTSLNGGALMNEGDSTNDGQEWKLEGPYFDAQLQKKTRLRTVYTFEDPDHFTLAWFTPGADGKETRTVHIAHTRKK